MHSYRLRCALAIAIAVCCLRTGGFSQSLTKIGELELPLNGLTATVNPAAPVIPKNLAGGVRVVIDAGSGPLTAEEANRYFGGQVQAQAELSGPGLSQIITVPDTAAPINDPLLIAFPPLDTAGDYTLSNIRLMVNGVTALNVSPGTIPVRVIDQVLVTSVETHPMTMEEIQAAGIVLDDSSYRGFQFTVGLLLESQVVNLSFPVVFDNNGIQIPQPLSPPPDPIRDDLDIPVPQIVPVMLDIGDRPGGGGSGIDLPELAAAGVKIPAVLVIPGSVGYLKQFFAADLYVANGAPGGSNLVVRNITGTIKMPAGDDAIAGNEDDPLTLPNTTAGPQPVTRPILGPDTEDNAFNPGESGKAAWSIRGEKEGFQSLTFDINGTLEGLTTGPVGISGVATGGVLVRNPYFDMTFTVPSVVRKGEHFNLYITVSNISQALANDVTVALNRARMSGLVLVGDTSQRIAMLRPRDARTLTFEFESLRTGKVVASYLHLDTEDGSTGQLNFTVGIGERGVPLSPDTLALPVAVNNLPADVVDAAMRVLGQAWSIANAPTGTLPSDVIRVSRTVVTQKALALAEAGLRVSFNQPVENAIRDLITDFYGAPIDRGFDQLLRKTDAGQNFARVLGSHLSVPVANAGGAVNYFRRYADLLASGPDLVSFVVAGDPSELLVSIDFADAANQHLKDTGEANVNGGVLIPIPGTTNPATLGMMTSTVAWPYTLTLTGKSSSTVDLAFAMPNGDGKLFFAQAASVAVSSGERMKVVFDIFNPSGMSLWRDVARDGSFSEAVPLSTELILPQGPQFISATVVGPETLDGAYPYGKNLALLFDRAVDTSSAAKPENYLIAKNAILSASPQLSGRLVFGNVSQPEGPYVPTQVSVSGLADRRAAVGPGGTVALQSRLRDPGAVVTGRVFNGDGSIASTAKITYVSPVYDPACQTAGMTGVAQTALEANGHYEFRYVWQAGCGGSFQISTNDPNSGALRSVSDSVRSAGERIVLDLVMMGRGTVTGTVRDLQSHPVYGAKVTAVSVSDPQMGGAAITDANGAYSISGLTVGTVSVTAGKGISLGHSTGEIPRAGSTGVVDITLDGGVVVASGAVTKLQGGVSSILPGIPVAYYLRIPNRPPVAVGATTTGVDGRFQIEGMPTGDYLIKAYLNTRDFAEVAGTAGAGDDIRDLNLTIRVDDASFGSIAGTVRLPGGAPAAGVIVYSESGSGTTTNADGSYQLTGISVQPFVAIAVHAVSKDYLRSGQTMVTLTAAGQSVSGADISLSGLGDVTFTVLNSAGQPLPGVQVGLPSPYCTSACGCNQQTTGIDGKVSVSAVSLGTITAKALKSEGGVTDVATGTATISRDGTTGYGILQFEGKGVVTGKVLDPDGRPAFGANVALSARTFYRESCSLQDGVAQTTRTDSAGNFRFTNVNIGSVGVSVSSPFFPTRVGATGTLARAGDSKDFSLQLVSTISGTLSGTVFLPDGTTPAGAGVQVTANGPLPDVTVSTDLDGHFEFASIFPEGNYSVTASDPITGLQVRDYVYLRSRQDTLHDLRLKGRGNVRVTVVDGADTPVDEAIVTLQEDSFPNERYDGVIEASNQGVVTFQDVVEGPLDIKVVDPYGRGGRTSATLPKGTASLSVKVQLTTTGTVQGHFYMPDRSTGIPNGVIRLMAGGRLIGQITSAGTGDIGAYSFDYVPAGPIRIEAQDPSTARTGVAVTTVESQGQLVTADVYAQALGRVQGTVTSNGAPQPGAQVLLDSGPYTASTSTDSNGEYLVNGVPEGVVHATASLDNGFLQGSSSAPLSGEGAQVTIDVALRDSGQIRGRVLNHNGTPAPPSLVTVTIAGSGGATLSVTSDAEGNFFFNRVPSGSGTIKAQVLGGLNQAKTAVEVPGSGTANVDILLNGVGSINGLALDSSGNPTAGTVVLTGSDPFPYSYTLTPGNNGRFALPEVLAEEFTGKLRVEAKGFTLYGSNTGTVKPGESTEFTIQVQPTGTVTGRVLRPDGTSPAVGANVTLQLAQVRSTYQVQNDGTFMAVGVPLGPFTVRVSDPLTNGLGLVDDKSLESNGDTVDLGTIVLDNTSLAVVSITPEDGSSGVGVRQPITIVFTDALGGPSGIYVSTATHTISSSATLSEDRKTVTLEGTWPDSDLITVHATTSLKDIFGRALSQPVAVTFQTVDLTAPIVTSVLPQDGMIQVLPEAKLVITFSEPLDTSSNLQSIASLSGPGGPVTGTAQQSAPNVILFTPAAPLAVNSIYSIQVANETDLSGNSQANRVTSTFVTLDTVPPVLYIISPTDGSFVNSATPSIRVAISDTLSGIATATGALFIDDAQVSPSVGTSQITYLPPAPFGEGQHSLRSSVADRAGNSDAVAGSFTVDTVSPTQVAIEGVTEGQVVSGTITVTLSAQDVGSGVERIDFLVNGSVRASVVPPESSIAFNTYALEDGVYAISAVAIDKAGNRGPLAAAINVIARQHPLAVRITWPVASSSFQNSVTFRAAANKAVEQIEFRLGDQVQVIRVAPYDATFDLSGMSEGEKTVLVTATAVGAETDSRSISIFVDRTAPAAPNPQLIYAAPPLDGMSNVYGASGAIEANTNVRIRNTVNGSLSTATAGGAGSFGGDIAAASEDILEITPIDQAGNEGPSVVVTVQAVQEMPLPAWLAARYYHYTFNENGSVCGAGSFGSNWSCGSEDGASQLAVIRNGVVVPFTGAAAAATEMNGRQFVVTQAEVAGLSISRKMFVPENGYFARYVEVLRNHTADPITIDMRITGMVSSAISPTQIVASSSGNRDLNVDGETPDRWVVISGPEDAQPYNGEYWNPPPIAMVFDGPDAAERVGAAEFSLSAMYNPTLTYEWKHVTVPPDGTVAYMHFAVQQTTRQAAQISAERLLQLPPEAIEGLTAQDRAAIRNFAVPADGSSALAPFRFGTVTGHVFSGDGIPIHARVTFRSNNPIYGYPESDYYAVGNAFSFTNAVIDGFTLVGRTEITGHTGVPINGDFPPDSATTERDVVMADTGSVSGVVRFHSGAVVAGGSVVIQIAEQTGSVASGADGHYLIPGVPAGNFEIRAWLNGLEGATSGVAVAGRSITADITLQTTGRLVGTVRRANGDPAPDTTVYVYGGSFSRSTTTDSAGRYAIDDVVLGTVAVSAWGVIESTQEQVEILLDQTTVHDITLPGVGSVRVIARTIAGMPLSDLYVTVYNRGATKVSRTDANGVATISGIPVGSFSVKGGYGYAFGTMHQDGETVDVELADAAGRVQGTIFAGDGVTPLDADYVEVLNSDGTAGTSAGYRMYPSADGKYQLDVQAAVAIIRAHYGALFVDAPVSFVANNQVLTANITIPVWRGEIHGHVFQQDGSTPIADVAITAMDSSGARWLGNASTNADGAYTLSLFANETSVSAQYLNVTSHTVVQFSRMDDSVNLDFTLPLVSATVRGTIYAEDGNTPIPGVIVTLLSASGGALATDVTSGSGQYQVGSISSRDFVLDVNYGAATPLLVPGSIAQVGDSVTQDVIIPSRVSIKGLVSYSDGGTVDSPSIIIGGDSSAYYGISGSDGAFVVFDVPVGPFWITASDSSSLLQASADNEIVDVGTPVTINLVLPSASLSGRISDASGGPAAFASVSVQSAGAPGAAQTVTADENGAYSFERLPAGPFILQAMDSSQVARASRAGVLTAQETQVLDITLPGTGSLSGQVVDFDGVSPVPNASVYIDSFGEVGPQGSARTTVFTDGNGRFLGDNVPAGRTRVSLSSWGGYATTADITVQPDQTTDATIRFGNARTLDARLGAANDTYVLSCRGAFSNAVLSSSNALLINGSETIFPCFIAAEEELGGRQLVYGPVGMGGVEITRKIFVPETGGFVRSLETVANNGSAPVELVIANLNRFQDTPEPPFLQPWDTGYTYAAYDTATGTTAQVMSSPEASAGTIPPAEEHWWGEMYQWNLTLAPGQKIGLLHFSVDGAAGDLSGIQARAETFVNLTNASALYGLTEEEKAEIANFSIH